MSVGTSILHFTKSPWATRTNHSAPITRSCPIQAIVRSPHCAPHAPITRPLIVHPIISLDNKPHSSILDMSIRPLGGGRAFLHSILSSSSALFRRFALDESFRRERHPRKVERQTATLRRRLRLLPHAVNEADDKPLRLIPAMMATVLVVLSSATGDDGVGDGGGSATTTSAPSATTDDVVTVTLAAEEVVALWADES